MWNFLRVSRKSSWLATTSRCLASGAGYDWLGAMEWEKRPGGVTIATSIDAELVETGVTGATGCSASGRGGNGGGGAPF